MNVKIKYDDNGREYTTRRALSPSSYNKLLENVNIGELLSYLNIPGKKIKTKDGYLFCCPFHNEQTASFRISDSQKIYHCFACGVGGSYIDLIKQYKNISSLEAINIARNYFPITGLKYENTVIDLSSVLDDIENKVKKILLENNRNLIILEAKLHLGITSIIENKKLEFCKILQRYDIFVIKSYLRNFIKENYSGDLELFLNGKESDLSYMINSGLRLFLNQLSSYTETRVVAQEYQDYYDQHYGKSYEEIVGIE